MKEFKHCNPIVNFMYFISVIVFSGVFLHPFSLIISLVCSFAYSVILNGKKAVKFNLLIVFPTMVGMAVLNPIFNHEGTTILCYLPSNNPLTLESIANGVAVGMMTGSVIMWFSCYNAIVTSDKLMYLTGKLVPSLSLVITMVLRFVPMFIARLKEISTAQNGIGINVNEGKILQRGKNGIKILSILVTWSLENAIETSQSMKSRGFGLKKRTSFSNIRFTKRDALLLFIITLFVIYVIIGAATGSFKFLYYPKMSYIEWSCYSVSVFVSYFVLCIIPVIFEIVEDRKWKLLRSKI